MSTALKAYFDYANAELNGVNGKKLKLVVKDDAYEPERTSKNVDELITKDGVFAFSGVLGTPNNLAVWDKLNEQCIPHLFPSTGAPDWGDVVNHPWTVAGRGRPLQPRGEDVGRLPQDQVPERHDRCAAR